MKIKSIPIIVAVPLLFFKWPTYLLMIALVWGEARSEPLKAKIAVVWIIENRVRVGGWFGKTHKKVMLKRKQFSCFNLGDPNRKKLYNPLKYESFGVWKECYEAVEAVLDRKVKDPTNGATHYHSRPHRPPYWAKKLEFVKKIGKFYFYKRKVQK